MAELTEKQLKYRRDLLAKIHLCDQYVFMRQNDCWQEFLEAQFGVDSAKELGLGELKNLLEHLLNKSGARQKTFNQDARGGKGLANLDDRYYTCPTSARFSVPPDPTIALKASDKQLEAIEILWDRFNLYKPQEIELGDFIRAKIHRVDRLSALTKVEAQKITGVLRKIAAFYEKKSPRRYMWNESAANNPLYRGKTA
jgi:hypothetical protein